MGGRGGGWAGGPFLFGGAVATTGDQSEGADGGELRDDVPNALDWAVAARRSPGGHVHEEYLFSGQRGPRRDHDSLRSPGTMPTESTDRRIVRWTRENIIAVRTTYS